MARTLTRARKPNLLKHILREQLGLTKGRVDREKGVVYAVKICGRTSPNTHGIHGIDGTDYTLEALESCKRLYEGMCVNVDHPSRTNPNADRSARDRFAWLENVTVQESGAFGDLHFLDPKDPLSVRVMNAAESKPDAFALSHNARGEGEVIGRRYVVRNIPECKSVDLVAYGGSNRSLYEGREKPMKTLKSILESVKVPFKVCKAIYEMDGMAPALDMEAPPPAPEPDAEETAETHIGRAIMAILNDVSLSPEEKKKKVLLAVKLVSDEEPAPADDVAVPEGDGEEGKGEPAAADDEEKKAMKESREAKAEVAKLRNELAVKSLCESEEFKPTALQTKILLGLEAKDRPAFIKESRGSKPRVAPRSGSARVLTESSEPAADRKSFVASLCG